MGLSAGRRLGPYEILAPLGAGGTGEVWEAKDKRLDRRAAIRILSEALFEDKDRGDRLEKEAKLLAAVNHPSIAAAFSFKKISGRYLIVQELLERKSFRERQRQGRLPPRKTAGRVAALVRDEFELATKFVPCLGVDILSVFSSSLRQPSFIPNFSRGAPHELISKGCVINRSLPSVRGWCGILKSHFLPEWSSGLDQ